MLLIVKNYSVFDVSAYAIINDTDSEPLFCNDEIYSIGGEQLWLARKKLGRIRIGKSAMTSGYNLNAPYVIHTAGPTWDGVGTKSCKQLRKCYESALKLAYKNGFTSVVFPLISIGKHQFPKHLSLEIAKDVINKFLSKHDLMVYIVLQDQDTLENNQMQFVRVNDYINKILGYSTSETDLEDDTYASTSFFYVDKLDKSDAESHDFSHPFGSSASAPDDDIPFACGFVPAKSIRPKKKLKVPFSNSIFPKSPISYCKGNAIINDNIEKLLSETDAGFSETLLKLIDKTGKKDSEIYKKANIDRKLFSKIRNNREYKPSKATAIAFAIALELNLEETKDFIARAGFALSHSSKFDIIIEYFITNRNYNIIDINETLFEFDQNLLGA